MTWNVTFCFVFFESWGARDLPGRWAFDLFDLRSAEGLWRTVFRWHCWAAKYRRGGLWWKAGCWGPDGSVNLFRISLQMQECLAPPGDVEGCCADGVAASEWTSTSCSMPEVFPEYFLYLFVRSVHSYSVRLYIALFWKCYHFRNAVLSYVRVLVASKNLELHGFTSGTSYKLASEINTHRRWILMQHKLLLHDHSVALGHVEFAPHRPA